MLLMPYRIDPGKPLEQCYDCRTASTRSMGLGSSSDSPTSGWVNSSSSTHENIFVPEIHHRARHSA